MHPFHFLQSNPIALVTVIVMVAFVAILLAGSMVVVLGIVPISLVLFVSVIVIAVVFIERLMMTISTLSPVER